MGNNLKTIIIFKSDGYYDRIRHVNRPTSSQLAITDINFNPNDGIRTSLVVNMSSDYTDCNYLQVKDNDKIESDWFIVGISRLREGQYQLSLKRDSIADYWGSIDGSMAVIERGFTNNTNPLIYNDEPNISVNQIKTQEIPIYDNNHCGWAVLYLSSAKYDDDGKTEMPNKWTVEYGIQELSGDLTINTPIEEYPIIKKCLNKTVHTSAVIRAKAGIVIQFSNAIFNLQCISGSREYNGSYSSQIDPLDDNRYRWSNSYTVTSDINDAQVKFILAIESEGWDNIINSDTDIYLDDDDYASLIALKGKLIKDSEGNVYQVQFTPNQTDAKDIPLPTDAVLKDIDTRVRARNSKLIAGFPKDLTQCYSIQSLRRFSISIVPYAISKNTFTLNRYEDCKCIDADYDIIAIPFSVDSNIHYKDSVISKENAISLITSIGRTMTSHVAYDIQSVPYVNIPNLKVSKASNGYQIDDSAIPAHLKCDVNNELPIYWVNRANFSESVIIDTDISNDIDDIASKYGISDIKLANVCSLARLTSPNYNGSFEYSLAKNGYKDYPMQFNIDVSLKPYSPYIHIAPDFHGLYGQDFNDARGLTCQGDFSLGMVNDQWANYELTNKNYQNMFNRQIEHMDVMQSYQNTSNWLSAFSGGIQAGGMGAGLGGLLGGPIGAAIGAVVGGASSIGAGIGDVYMQQSLYQENKSYAVDNFNMQLGNIKALPYTLTKVSALTENNKIVPILEIYYCTKEEMEYVANKLSKTGYYLNVMDTLSNSNYTENFYLKCSIFRFKDNTIPENIKYDINTELTMGITIKEE